ncbi:phasin family protein [Paraburkholderia sp. MM5496-R1]|uniref:TIGR01841 family phasin n=1 Tax=unclassified Paraburkholderia TaxID=2615204 RepID=UPI003D1A3159
MSSLAPKQIFAAQKAGVDMTFAVLNEVVDGVAKLVELNVQAVKSMLAENQEVLSTALSAKKPRQLFLQQATQTTPALEKAQSYWRHVHGILSSTVAGVTSLAEARLKQRQTGSRGTAKLAGDVTETDDSVAASSTGATAVPAVLE